MSTRVASRFLSARAASIGLGAPHDTHTSARDAHQLSAPQAPQLHAAVPASACGRARASTIARSLSHSISPVASDVRHRLRTVPSTRLAVTFHSKSGVSTVGTGLPGLSPAEPPPCPAAAAHAACCSLRGIAALPA